MVLVPSLLGCDSFVRECPLVIELLPKKKTRACSTKSWRKTDAARMYRRPWAQPKKNSALASLAGFIV